jgi:hypothetical protein
MASPSCSFNKPIPTPPTTGPAFAVPVGGSNATILDTCCNGHINPIRTYSAPDEDDCYMYCNTDSPDAVMTCLSQPQMLGAKSIDANNQNWNSFNVEENRVSSSDYDSGIDRLRLGKVTTAVIAMAFLTAIGMS